MVVVVFSYTNWLNWIEFDRSQFTHKLRIVLFIVSLWQVMRCHRWTHDDGTKPFLTIPLISIHILFRVFSSLILCVCARAPCVFCFWYLFVYTMHTDNMDSFPLFHSSFRFGAFSNLLSFHNCERVSFTQTSFKRIASYLNTRKLFFSLLLLCCFFSNFV